MEGNGRGAAGDSTCLPAELRLHILSLLPPNELALGGRLSSKDAAQRFTEPTCRTADLRQPLPKYASSVGWDSAQAVLRQLTFRQKLHVPATAAASGCGANVEIALQLLQPHVFPEVLGTDSSYTWAYDGSPCMDVGATVPPTPDLGSAATYGRCGVSGRGVWPGPPAALPGAALPRAAGPGAHPGGGGAALRPGGAAGGVGGAGAAAAEQHQGEGACCARRTNGK